MLPIDQVLNSQRMLLTSRYQRKEYNLKEDRWFIKYLIDLGWEKNKIFEIWKKIFLTRERNSSFSEEVDIIFEDFYKKAKKIKKLLKFPTVKVFQEELDIINRADMPLQVKQFSLLLLVYSKLIRQYQYLNIDGVLVELKRMTTIKRQVRGDRTILTVMKEQGLIKNIDFDTESCYFVEKNEYSFQRITYVKKKGKEAFNVCTILDVPKYFDLLHCRKKCPLCGKEYDVSPKSKTDLCQECQKEKRKNRIIEFSKSRRHEKEKNHIWKQEEKTE